MNNTYIQLLSMAVFKTVLTLNNGAFLPLLHYNRGSEEKWTMEHSYLYFIITDVVKNNGRWSIPTFTSL